MNKKLREAKDNVKKIVHYCESRPTPTHEELEIFISVSNLNEYERFAEYTLNAIREREYIFHLNKINKYR